jgi:hypothetical protein
MRLTKGDHSSEDTCLILRTTGLVDLCISIFLVKLMVPADFRIWYLGVRQPHNP